MSRGVAIPGFVAAVYPPFQTFVRTRGFGLTAALLSLVVLLLYVFGFTPYQEFLFSDMGKYWTSAMTRLNENPFEDPQFVAWPPMYHIFIAELFRVFRWLGLEGLIRLETVLSINITAFAVSVYALQRLAIQWFARSEFIFITVLLYAFGFPSLYFNAFLLSGNLGMPLMICAFALIAHKQALWAVATGGLLFALAVIVRPSFGPYGLAFVLYYLVRYGMNRQFISRAALFSAVFFAVVLLASLEVARISNGKVFGLSANGGLDFFITMSKFHKVDLNYDGWHFMVVAPALSWEPEYGTFYTNVPFYEQGYYFSQGWEFLKRNPMRLFRSFEHMGHLFFADMLPSRVDAPGFTFWRPVWDWFKFIMFLTFGLYAWMWRRLGERKPEFVMMISIILLTLMVSAIFTGEPRYTYAILFVFYLLFFKLIELYREDRRGWLRPVLIYAALLLTATAATAAINEVRRWDLGPRGVRLTMLPDSTSPPVEAEVRRVLFPYGKNKIGLFHVTEDYPPLQQAGPVRMHTRMEVFGAEPLLMEFEMYSAWRFRFYLDKRELLVSENTDYFTASTILMQLEPGVHEIEIVLEYTPVIGGFAASYNYWESNGWRVRRFLGVSWDKIRFLLPETTAAIPPQ
jgi:hypothetical protein